jgi:hypothetical protein
MTRRLFTILRVLSLVLLVATVAAWVRSYWVGDYIRVHAPIGSGGSVGHRITHFWSAGGQVKVERVDVTMPATPANEDFAIFGAFSSRAWDVTEPEPRDFFYPPQGPTDVLAGLRVATHDRQVGSATVRGWGVIVPLWLPVLLLTLPTVATVRSRRRRKANARAGLCPQCGYDLRATPARCPECGMVPVVKGAA